MWNGQIMLLVGDVNEAIFVGLSHSIDDSIQGLIFMLIQIRSGIRLLLLPASFQKERQIGPRGREETPHSARPQITLRVYAAIPD